MTGKMPLKKRVSITARGYGILNKYCPGLVSGRALSAVVSSLQPFASIWFSAQIINELADKKRLNMIILYASAVVLINFTSSLVRSLLDRVTNEKESLMWRFFGKVFADKQMSMDYADLEDAKIVHQRKQAEENLYMFGNGLGQLVWGVKGLVTSVVSISVSISMTITLFTARSTSAIVDHPIWIGVLLLLIALGGLSNSKAVVRENIAFKKWCTDTVWFNRAFMFFGMDLYMQPERAKDVRIYEQNTLADKVLQKLLQNQDASGAAALKMSLYQPTAAVVIGLINALCYLFVALKAALGAFGVGSIVQYVGVLSRLGQGVNELMYVITDNAVYCEHLQGLYDFLDIPNGKQRGTLPVQKRDGCDYQIEFQNVSFKYPGADSYALRNVSIKLRVSKRLAIVGQNGSGKTTFIKLLCRLYDPTEGVILLDGVDIREYDYNEYRRIFSVVFQDFKLFAFSLGENVAADVDYDATRAEDCLVKAGFGDRLCEMPERTETLLYKDFDEKGVEISGGEAQKIALARALYKNAPFIVLDEPTAALDPVAESEIYANLNGIIGERTAIFISHRLSSCRFCDDIAVFDCGMIVQRGSHDDLVTGARGKYREMWFAQSQYYN